MMQVNSLNKNQIFFQSQASTFTRYKTIHTKFNYNNETIKSQILHAFVS